MNRKNAGFLFLFKVCDWSWYQRKQI